MDFHFIATIIALAVLPVLWLSKTYLGVGENQFYDGLALLALFGGRLVLFLLVPAVFLGLGWILKMLYNLYMRRSQ
jgi:hypothetical protein